MRVLRVAMASLLLAPAACVSARDCAKVIREEIRADAIRLALDKDLMPQGLVPRDDLALALGAGRPWQSLKPEELHEVEMRATGYAHCLRERVDR